MAAEYIWRQGRRIEVETLESHATPKQRRQRADPYIGCPLEWLKRILALVKTKEQLAVAIWLHRRRAICHSELFTVPNDVLQKELGLNRRVKYQSLQYLERAKVITIVRDGRRALQIRIL
jgi:hypothetical protein